MTLDDFKEIFDTRLLIPIFGATLLWITIDFLMNISSFPNAEIIKILIFSFMIIFSLCFIMFLGIKADFKENLELTKLILAFLFALTGIYASSIIIALISGNVNLTSIVAFWKITSFSIPSGEQTLQSPIVLNFVSLSQTLNINPNTAYELFTNWFLVAPAEELTFRGVGTYLCTKMLEPITGHNAKGGILIGGLISNGIWASVHSITAYTGPEMLIWVLTAYVGGVFFLLAMLYSKNILASIIAHAIYNSVVVLVTATKPASIIPTNFALNTNTFYSILIVSSLVVVSFISWIKMKTSFRLI